MRSQTDIITAPSFTQGTQSCTLGNGCARLGLTRRTYPTPREHNPAPSATDAHASRNPNRPSQAKGAPHCTLGGRNPRRLQLQLSHPTPREHNIAPSDADAVANCHHHRAILHPRSTIPHTRRQTPTPAATSTGLSHAQGAQSCTLGSGNPAGCSPNPSYLAPREHNNAPSAAEASGDTACASRQPRTAPPASACKGPATARADAGL
ncbi:hypothetical protein CLV65_1249 [Pseudoscardovia suis]|uniref:Uncharacterized protein n=1 Tax=Pseudoscardovia suis TaxID=987063 RepID=A0A261ER17_9BIFI|nr:hypothetical protein PSSU_1621 [Pseudoscardovia suis]PJJ65997.1 hypothetical protein CLV65_1249 [Pseudoscardovia suis]